jgi:FMN phosphatase YigB (HAD superfamily)/uracil phosphoribosyltransferase
MTKKSTYYLSQDTNSIFTRLARSINPNLNGAEDRIRELTEKLFKKIADEIRNAYANVLEFSEETIQQELTRLIQEQLAINSELKVVCLDRYLLTKTDISIERFELARKADGSRVARQGAKTIPEQLKKLKERVGDNPVILVDDGIFTGGTTCEAAKYLEQSGIKVESIVVFTQNPETVTIQGIPIISARKLTEMIDWIDSRDFTLLGGRLIETDEETRTATSSPYFQPFSDGSAASLDTSFYIRPISIRLLKAFRDTIVGLEKIIGTPITTEMVTNAGFPIASCKKLPKTTPKTLIKDTAAQALSLLKVRNLRAPKEIYLDMDGTLYSFIGGDTYEESNLKKEVEKQGILFIQKTERCSSPTAKLIWEEATNNLIGQSQFLAKRYSISREEYFEQTWGEIDPTKCITPAPQLKETLKSLAEGKGIPLRLLTAAPKVWATKVLKYLEIDQFFTSTTTGEEFESKAEVFNSIGRMADYMLSVGDQWETDLEPATKVGDLGMDTYQVGKNSPLEFLMEIAFEKPYPEVKPVFI